MASSLWSYSPDYTLSLTQPATGSTPARTWRLHSLRDATLSLSTTNVGTAQVALYDYTGALADLVAPHSDDVLEAYTTNRYGHRGRVWAGYVNDIERSYDPDAGAVMTLSCTSPYKRWEVARQTPDQVATLATAYLSNIAGSEVLKYSARAVGYPVSSLIIDPRADVGTGIWSSIPETVWTDPTQSTWSSMIQALLANSGLEFFFREDGGGVYRQIGYLPTPLPRVMPRITLEETLRCALTESDGTAITRVQVTWGPEPTIQAAAYAQAPAGMIAHLGVRTLPVYAPWLQTYAAAQYLAQVLLDQQASDVNTASFTIPADPRFQIGSLCAAPSLLTGKGDALYYISDVSYQLSWNGAWVMNLGLSYGRDGHNAFPYVGTTAAPVLSSAVAAGLPAATSLPTSPDNPRKVASGFAVVYDPTVQAGQVSTADFSTGSILQLRTSTGGGVGAQGEYVAVAAQRAQGTGTLGLSADAGATAYVTIIAAGYGDSGGDGSQNAQSSSISTPAATVAGTGSGATLTAPTLVTVPNGLAQRVLATAVALQGAPYIENHSGPDGYDCSGLVAAALAAQGFTGCQIINGGGSYNTDIGPNGLYTYLLGKGCVKTTIDATQPGDFLFIQHQDGTDPYKQQGFTHVGFCYTAGGFGSGVTYGANNPTDGLGCFTIASYRDNFGYPFDLALDASGLHL